MEDLTQYITPTLILPLLTLMAVFVFFGYYLSVSAPQLGTLEWITEGETRRPLRFSSGNFPMTRADALPLFLITVVYAFSAFWNLGSFQDPQTFQTFSASRTVEFSLDQEITLSKVAYYTGLNTGSYSLEYSTDGVNWESLPEMEQSYADLFKWMTVEPETGSVQARLFRLTASSSSLELGELAFFGTLDETEGISSLLTIPTKGARLLFDESETVPEVSTFENSTYFDEIYHARTAYEHIRGIYPYEVSHPPLGKLIISLGIRAFGMTPFGWRFMGTTFGVLMLPLLYVFIKNLFGKTAVAFCGTALFAFDFMHLTQTRIATIDTYGVFFILAMYFFLYRWVSLPPDAPFRKGALPLFLSGLSFGLGAASKWTVIYGAVGLALLYFVNVYFVWRTRRQMEQAPAFAPWAVKTLLFSVFVFVCIPAVIYCVSYLPYAQAKGDTSLSGLLKVVWDNQKFMLNYHMGVTAEHPYSSKWWQWLFDIRPILYYRSEVSSDGLRSAFAAFDNPVVSWTGLLGIGVLAVRTVRNRCGMALYLLVGYLSQLLPWLLISRPTFAYHYFPSMLFLVLAICYLMNRFVDRLEDHRWRLPLYGLTGLSTGLYVLFYPVLTGVMVPTWYTTWILKWLPSWPF